MDALLSALPTTGTLFETEVNFETINNEGDDNMTSMTKYEVYESLNEYKVVVALAGLTREEIEVDVKDNKLYINITPDEDGNYDELLAFNDTTKSDFILGTRLDLDNLEILLNETVDSTDATATFENGLLIVTIPKLEKSRSIKID